MMSSVAMSNYRNHRRRLLKMSKTMIKISEGEEEKEAIMVMMTSMNKININKINNNKFMVGMDRILCQGTRAKMRIIGQ